jgi:signal-transduction protein with cAMP-binding, CBS, and nucleotidyltransferase domain
MTAAPLQSLRRYRPFDRLSPERADALEAELELRQYQLGQT